MRLKLGIAKKMSFFCLFFILILYGTVLDLLINIQNMSGMSEQIVSINNEIGSLSKVMLDSIISMDVNDKKYRLLKKDIYLTYFDTARNDYLNALDKIFRLNSPEYSLPESWHRIQKKFEPNLLPYIQPRSTKIPDVVKASSDDNNAFENKPKTSAKNNSSKQESKTSSANSNASEKESKTSSGGSNSSESKFKAPSDKSDTTPSWISEPLLEEWIKEIANGRQENERQIEQLLININETSRQSVKKGLIGFGVSIVVGILGVWFISQSMLKPLNKLKNGLKGIALDNYDHVIEIKSNDEFGELASVFNDMSRQLKESESIRSDFIAILSHEIRTPLASIRESVNMIIEDVFGPINDKQRKFLEIASSEISRITTLLNHLLNVSMLKSDSEKIKPEPLDPNQLISDAAMGLIGTANSNNVELRVHALQEIPIPLVMGIRSEILQVLLNIIGNAIKFSYKNSFVDISLIKGTNGNELIFKVSDQGPGIPEEEHSLVFKKYYRSKEVRTHMDGVGLGLNISKRIIQAHGGTIYMENNSDKGCSFFFTLPTETGNKKS
ncbi:MAG: HAMP domain-containing histidine kinase [Desulfamplus sp.]|nr:HAMP domain-containing histidine kinase [Desulfamplus sp.]